MSETISRYSDLFYLQHSSGDRLYPVRRRIRRTGKLMFTLAPAAAGNRDEDAYHTECELEMRRLVLVMGYRVRAESRDRARSGLYAIDGHSVRAVVEKAVGA